jgi:hypothetical protein
MKGMKGKKMKQSAVEMYKAMREAHDLAVRSIAALEREVQEHENDAAKVADIAYALREVTELADDIRKRAAALGTIAQSVACMIRIAVDVSATSITTPYCTATLDVRQIVAIPKRSTDPEKFALLMDHFKVPRELWESGEHAAMQPHWPGLIDLIARHTSEGKPLPPGIDANKTFPKYSLRIRGRKDVAA